MEPTSTSPALSVAIALVTVLLGLTGFGVYTAFGRQAPEAQLPGPQGQAIPALPGAPLRSGFQEPTQSVHPLQQPLADASMTGAIVRMATSGAGTLPQSPRADRLALV
jgi:PsbN protein